MSEARPVIGLEIHVELRTRTKMFCNSANDPEERRPNVNVCPVCLGHPGVLPAINLEAVKQTLRVGAAVAGRPADYTEFERKNYFYPDLPKGYQISQYKHPLVTGGRLAGISLTRIHLEEDTGRLNHDPATDTSLIDFNRAGLPLMELVTEPAIASAKQAADFAREFQLLLRYLGVSDALMEKGQMRVEANISLSGPSSLGVKAEIKNLNSFRAVERAIDYEIKRQGEILAAGGKIVQETRGWDDTKGITVSQRGKESAHDYRYFPEPDLPPLKISEIAEFKNLAATLPELPWQRRGRYKKLNLMSDQVELLVSDERFSKIFDLVTREPEFNFTAGRGAIQLLANYICADIAGLVFKFGDDGLKNISPHGLGAIIIKLMIGQLSSRGAKDTLAEAFLGRGDLVAISQRYLQQSAAGELQTVVETVIKNNPQAVADHQAGKAAALQFLVGQGMKESRGAANPEVLKALLTKRLRGC